MIIYLKNKSFTSALSKMTSLKAWSNKKSDFNDLH